MDKVTYIIEFNKDGTATVTTSGPYAPDSVRTGGGLAILKEAIETLEKAGVIMGVAAASGYLTVENLTKPVVRT